jgi:hypothetical protein
VESIVPTVASPPAIPFTDQVTVVVLLPVTVAVNCCVWPTPTVTAEGETETWICVKVTVAVAVFELSATLVAVMVTDAGSGSVAGAVYRPESLIVPELAPPLSDQVTDVLEAFWTVAVNCWVWPVSTVAEVGEMEILTAGAGLFAFDPPQATKEMANKATSNIRK